MADIFSRNNDAYGGSFASDSALVTFPGFVNPANQPNLGPVGGLGDQFLNALGLGVAGQLAAGGGQAPSSMVGLLTQSINSQYNQILTPLREIGSNLVYYVGGRSQGSLGMARIIGPRPIAVGFYQKFGDLCDIDTNNIDLNLKLGSCPTREGGAVVQGQAGVYSHKMAVINSLGMNFGAQDAIINEQVQMLYTALNLDVQ